LLNLNLNQKQEINMRFKEKIVLVTGAASGIGLQIARQFVEEGATVIGTDINADTLSATGEELGSSFVARVSDAGDISAIEALSEWVKSEFGALDVLINNAGFARLATPEMVTAEDYAAQMNVLINGPVFLVKNLAVLLRASNNGSVINIASAAAVIAMPNYCPYGLAKAAISKFSEDCTISVPGVRHNAVLPGFIDTPILVATYGEEAVAGANEFLKSTSPVPRMGSCKDVADAVLFLASDEATFIAGVKLIVDGGISKVHALSMMGAG
jgi:meso-butanediol dehydrogenase/(S,S)-butanediol dehydrogenase/diacetyl reductase